MTAAAKSCEPAGRANYVRRVEYERAAARVVWKRLGVAAILATLLGLVWWSILAPFIK